MVAAIIGEVPKGLRVRKGGSLTSDKTIIRLGKWSEEELDRLIKAASLLAPGAAIERISQEFLGTPYIGFTLIGDEETPEQPVIDLGGLDCFTFLDYVEAMRISRSMAAFRAVLLRVRYRGGVVAFDARKHFFTDWLHSADNPVSDVTREIGGSACLSAIKRLNLKEDGTLYLPGIAVTEREVIYIPAPLIDESMTKRIETGDYIGIYSAAEGLDVSHVGIFVRQGNSEFLRHASSGESKMVVDQEFRAYVSTKPGIVVVRPFAVGI